VLWTHNDEGAELFAVDTRGGVLGRFRLDAAAGDPEDLAIAACQTGWCLYLSDTGDNQERRADGDARILGVREPDGLAEEGSLRADVFPLRLPDGPRDFEAIFVLPGERVFFITKGRNHAVTVYRYPGELRPELVTLEEVQRLTDGAQPLVDQVTGASASLDGSLVAVRTYRALRFYGTAGNQLRARSDGLVNLRPLEEIQGEGVAVEAGGDVWLTSEGGPLGGPASLTGLTCRV